MRDLYKKCERSASRASKTLAQAAEYRRIPVVMLSGSGLEQDVEAAYGLGVNTYFSKPANLHALLELIRLVVDYWSRAERPAMRLIR